MNLKAVVDALGLTVWAGERNLGVELSGGYVGDLMSDVIANAPPGSLWLTVQAHLNVVAVVAMKELAGVVLVNGKQPEEQTLRRARDENLTLMGSRLSAYELVGKLCAMGLSWRSGDAQGM
jgi:hypothetical protein